MKVIFVASGNKAVGSVSSFVQSQYDSLQERGLEMLLFPVVGKGAKAYLKAIPVLRRLIRRERPDVVHAHYSTCGYVAALASFGLKIKVVCSILGSFPQRNGKWRLVRFFVRHVWDKTIVKSKRTARQLGLELPVVPNGVNLSQFALKDKAESQKVCGFEEDKKYIVWCSNPSRTEKRFDLAQKAVALLQDENVVLFPVFNRTHDEVVDYMCAADVLLMSSFSEGSPNVIKEAMACNCPIVTSDVGDVRERLEGLDGCFVADAAPSYTDYSVEAEQLSDCLKKALEFEGRTKGRDRIINDGITTEKIAKKIIEIYESL